MCWHLRALQCNAATSYLADNKMGPHHDSLLKPESAGTVGGNEHRSCPPHCTPLHHLLQRGWCGACASDPLDLPAGCPGRACGCCEGLGRSPRGQSGGRNVHRSACRLESDRKAQMRDRVQMRLNCGKNEMGAAGSQHRGFRKPISRSGTCSTYINNYKGLSASPANPFLTHLHPPPWLS